MPEPALPPTPPPVDLPPRTFEALLLLTKAHGHPMRYAHPSGAQIWVFPGDPRPMLAVGADGKRKRTSATPDKLAAGHGLWKQVAE